MQKTDVAIVGGGPAGTATALFLADRGLRPVIVEKDLFPRFHIGESMTGECGNVTRLLGLQSQMERRGYPVKYGVRVFGPGGKNSFWVPVMGRDQAGALVEAATWQVRRSDFDHMLAQECREKGVRFVSGQAVAPLLDANRAVCGLRYRDAGGNLGEIRSGVLVDASGLHTFLSGTGVAGRKRRGRYHRQLAVFSHVRGAVRDPGRAGGNTLIFYQRKNHWAWFIPIDDQVTSIGVTVPAEYFRAKRVGHRAFLQQEITELHPELACRLEDIEFVEKVRAATNYSYQIKQFAGPGYLCVGDSHRFIDPVFSFGLHFAMSEARLAAGAIAAGLDGVACDSPDPFADYQRIADAGQDRIQDLIDAFWDHPLSFAYFVHHRYKEDFIDLFAGRVYGEEPYRGSRAIRSILDQAAEPDQPVKPGGSEEMS